METEGRGQGLGSDSFTATDRRGGIGLGVGLDTLGSPRDKAEEPVPDPLGIKKGIFRFRFGFSSPAPLLAVCDLYSIRIDDSIEQYRTELN